MKPSIDKAIADGITSLEYLSKLVEKPMSTVEVIDFSARVKGIKALAEKLEETLCDHIKENIFKNKPGEIPGERFRAMLIETNPNLFQVKTFADAHPALYEQYKVKQKVLRLTFPVR